MVGFQDPSDFDNTIYSTFPTLEGKKRDVRYLCMDNSARLVWQTSKPLLGLERSDNCLTTQAARQDV